MSKTGSNRSSATSVPDLLHRLCASHVKNPEKLASIYRHSLKILYSNITCSSIPNEIRLCQKIQKKLVVQHRERDAMHFTELHRRLKSQGVIQNCTALLQFLITVSENVNKQTGKPQDSILVDSFCLPESLLPEDSSLSIGKTGLSSTQWNSTPLPLQDSTNRSTVTSGISSFYSQDSTIRPQNIQQISGISSVKEHSPGIIIPTISSGRDRKDGEISEQVLVRDLMFVFQGIDGKYIRMNRSEDGYRVSNKITAHPSVIEHCHKLSELGWLYRRINKYVEAKTQDPSLGLVVQGFLSALTLELTEYYRLVAVLEAQLSVDQCDSKSSDKLSLRRLIVWTREPLERLKTLAILVDGCKGLRGGALLSTLYTYAQHGDPEVKGLVKHILNQVYRPINSLLNTWIFEGQLKDQFNEFFIAADLKTPEERLWHSKYSIRVNMLPKFISEEVAKKILTVGKSINFLRLRCRDHAELFSSEEKTWFMKEKDECTFDSMTGVPLSSIVNITYKETSKYLLHVLNTQYQFAEHLKAFRKYLLLGQGDFINHLMDIIQTELAKPATSCYVHNMTAILESAVKTTNAQYDEEDVLNRLDVQLLDASPGDTGWDVFSLQYRVDGPISTIFTQDTMLRYLQVFNFLWRGKRIEFILSGMWRNQMAYCRQLNNIPEFHSTLHQCQLLTGALVHFISQLQYYIMFECLECSWAELLIRIKSAVDLDEVITAHSEFLDVIVTRCLLDPHSQPLLTQLRTLFDLIVDFQSKQESMFISFLAEAEKRKEYAIIKEQRSTGGLWAESEEGSTRELQRRAEFKSSVVNVFHSQFTVLEHSYNDTLKSFLERVEGHIEENLQFLARRLDFNRFYRGTETASFVM